MTTVNLRAYLDRLGWSTNDLADRAAVSPVTVRRWLNGKLPIPEDVERILQQMAALAAELPRKPTDW